jgi:hypothetical protein
VAEFFNRKGAKDSRRTQIFFLPRRHEDTKFTVIKFAACGRVFNRKDAKVARRFRRFKF